MDHWNFQFPKLSEMTQLDIKLHSTLPVSSILRTQSCFHFFPPFPPSFWQITHNLSVWLKKIAVGIHAGNRQCKNCICKVSHHYFKAFFYPLICRFVMEIYARLTKSIKDWVWNIFWNYGQVTKVSVERLAHRTSFIFHIFKSSDYANIKKNRW